MDANTLVYTFVKVDMKNEAQYQLVHDVRRTFIDDLGDNQASLIEDDEECDIFLLFNREEPVATGRIHKKTETSFKLERIAVLKKNWGKGYGKELMRQLILKTLEVAKPSDLIYLHAQTHAVGFYEKCGFEKVGEMFIEDETIEHYKMIFRVPSWLHTPSA